MLFEVKSTQNPVTFCDAHEVRRLPENLLVTSFDSYDEALVRATFLNRMHADHRAANWRKYSVGFYIEACFSAYVKSMRLIGAQVLTRQQWERAVAEAPRHQPVYL